MSAATRWLRRPAVALAVDLVLVVVFAAAGRASHDEGSGLVAVLRTAWPFLMGTAVGWAVVRLRARAWPLAMGPGITVWLATLVVGMVLRRVTGGGTPPSFVAVAAVVLALFLVGWRALLGALARSGPARA